MSSGTSFAGATTFPVQTLALADITRKDQIRKHFDEERLQELGESIKADGLVQPIVVRPLGDGYELVAGERRFRAAMKVGITSLPAVVRSDLTEQSAVVLQAIENLQREDLTLSEECAFVTAMVDAIGFEATCTRLSKSESWVSKRSTVRELPREIQLLVEDGKVKDLEMARDLGQLAKYSPKKAAELVTLFTPGEYDEPEEGAEEQQEFIAPSRESIRSALRYAKSDFQHREDMKLRRAAEKDDPAALKRKQKQKAEEATRKARVEKVKQLESVAVELETRFVQAFAKLLGFKVPKRNSYGYRDIPVHADTQYLTEYRPVPASIGTTEFTVHAEGDVLTIKRISEVLGSPKLRLRVDLPEVTLEQCVELERVLGRGKVGFKFSHETNGGGIEAAIRAIQGAEEKTKRAAGTAEKQGEMFISKFLSQRLDRKDKKAQAKASDVYAAYETWCDDEGSDPIAFNDNRWGEAIAAAGIEKKRISTGYHYLGVKLK